MGWMSQKPDLKYDLYWTNWFPQHLRRGKLLRVGGVKKWTHISFSRNKSKSPKMCWKKTGNVHNLPSKGYVSKIPLWGRINTYMPLFGRYRFWTTYTKKNLSNVKNHLSLKPEAIWSLLTGVALLFGSRNSRSPPVSANSLRSLSIIFSVTALVSSIISCVIPLFAISPSM